MKLGQTSIVDFVSRFTASALGFVATVFIARLLGSETLGIYFLVLSTASWLAIAGDMGINSAVTKRISEGEQETEYAVAGAALIAALFLVITAAAFVFSDYLDSYLGHPATHFVVLIVFVTLANSLVDGLLQGEHLVHLTGVFSTIRTGVRSAVQIAAVFAGFGLAGLFIGYSVGYVLVSVLGVAVLVRRFERISLPDRRHFESILSFARFSWISNLRSQAMNWVDIAVLGFFVSSSLVGIYSAAWNISIFLIIFGTSVSMTLFPEMSRLSADQDPKAVTNLVEMALTYAGLVLIPGFVGGTLLGERILRIYGDEFTQGATVLSILILAVLIQGYQKQFTTTLNAIDRPDKAFRVNAVFIVANVALNVAFIYFFGLIGAAVATTLSIAISLVVAYHMLSSLVDFTVPLAEIGKQWVAAGVMGVAVYAGLVVESSYLRVGHNVAVVLALVALGAGVYFVTLLGISSRFRTTVTNNLPFDAKRALKQ